MKKIKIEKWKGKDPEGNEVEEDLMIALNVLVNGKSPEEMPRGLDKFRIFNRITKAFDKASKSDMLELEDGDYKFLKDIVESDLPSRWGANPNIVKAIENFLNPEEE